MATYWFPTRPYSLIDAVNRMAAATGSCRYAQLSHYADYNGHHVTVTFNDYRRYWVTQSTDLADYHTRLDAHFKAQRAARVATVEGR